VSLKQITDAVTAQLAADGVTVTVEFGGENVYRHDAPPRLVWVPKSGQGAAPAPSGGSPRAIRTRVVTVEAHVWGASTDPNATSGDHFAAAEALLNSIAAAVHRVAVGSYEFVGETWPELNDQLLALGRVVVATFVFRIPVTAPPVATATPTAATLTATLQVPTP
jgi:hypothetical protein